MEDILRFSGCTISSSHCQCFDKLTGEESKELDAHSVQVKYGKGEIICKQGGMVSNVMYVEQGLVKVFLDDGTNSLVLKIIPDGNMVGLASVSEGSNKYEYSAKAYIDTVIRQIDINFFRELLGRNSGFAKDVIDTMGDDYGYRLSKTRKK